MDPELTNSSCPAIIYDLFLMNPASSREIVSELAGLNLSILKCVRPVTIWCKTNRISDQHHTDMTVWSCFRTDCCK